MPCRKSGLTPCGNGLLKMGARLHAALKWRRTDFLICSPFFTAARLRSKSDWRRMSNIDEMPRNCSTRSAVSAETPFLPAKISLSRLRGMPIFRAACAGMIASCSRASATNPAAGFVLRMGVFTLLQCVFSTRTSSTSIYSSSDHAKVIRYFDRLELASIE